MLVKQKSERSLAGRKSPSNGTKAELKLGQNDDKAARHINFKTNPEVERICALHFARTSSARFSAGVELFAPSDGKVLVVVVLFTVA